MGEKSMGNIELQEALLKKYQRLIEAITSKGDLLVAYSGGVDSALLAKIAYDTLGNNAWAVFVNSETVSAFELEEAKKLAAEIEIKFGIIETIQLSDADFIRNDAKRCFFCRKNMAKCLIEFAKKKGIINIAAGAHASDLNDFRPGIQAFHDAGIWHPFIEFEFSKSDVRELSRHLKLPFSEKPAMPCLSSRIQYGQKIDQETLTMLGAAEDFLRELGFKQYRARTHDRSLRIEIFTEEFDKLMANRVIVIKKMKELGYKYISLDLEGFRSGSMNEALQ